MLFSSDLSRNSTGWLGPHRKHEVYSKSVATTMCWTKSRLKAIMSLHVPAFPVPESRFCPGHRA